MAWLLRVVPLDQGEPGHLFGGDDPAAPPCPWCGEPLTRDLLLDGQDPRLGLEDLGVQEVPLYYCHRCRMNGSLAYRLGPTPEVAGHEGSPGVRGLRRVFWRLGLRLEPAPAEIEEWYPAHRGVPREGITDRRLLGHLATAPHQVGGPLWWPHGPVHAKCPNCGRAPEPLGMLFADPGRGMGYGPSGLLHLLLCREDRILVVTGEGGDPPPTHEGRGGRFAV